MENYILTLIIYIIPTLLIAVPLVWKIDIKSNTQRHKNQPTLTPKNNIFTLEKKLSQLIANNHLSLNMTNLNQDLQNTKSHIIAGYLNTKNNNLKGFRLFQLIFSLIKNQTADDKIIKIMHHWLPSCSNNHLQSILYSYKVFLNIIYKDNIHKILLKDLNKNDIRSTLFYLEQKLNQTINKISNTQPNLQEIILEEAVTYGLIFASFSEFSDSQATEKVLTLCYSLSPKLFKFWHTFPHQDNIESIENTSLYTNSPHSQPKLQKTENNTF